MTKYKIIDRQFNDYRYFAEGAIFGTKEAVRQQLIDYHSIDCEDIEQLKRMSINEILEYGEWELEEI